MEIQRKTLEGMLRAALTLEINAIQQYEAHLGQLRGLDAPAIVVRFLELISDEKKHVVQFTELLTEFLGAELEDGAFRATKPPKEVHSTREVIEANIHAEKEGIDLYKEILEGIDLSEAKLLPYGFQKLRHEMLHIIVDEEEHLVELQLLLE